MNVLDTNDTTQMIQHETEKQIMTRAQKHSIINSRDQIFIRKENYLYFLNFYFSSANGESCDKESKQLQKRNLVPRIKKVR